MNILHMKYAVEVAKCGSINKAAEQLLMNQPNLSRAIKELEASLGVTIFSRSARGMVLTPDGEVFLGYANSILKQVDEVENLFKNSSPKKRRFSISVPRASYISEAFARFSAALDSESDTEIFYKETNSRRAINNILGDDYKLGIIRYASNFDRFYKALFDDKGLSYELVTDFSYRLVVNRDSPLARLENITYKDLEGYLEIAHADPFVPSVPVDEALKDELTENVRRRIFVFERASQFDILSHNREAFMWVSPIPKQLLERYGLTERNCSDNTKMCKDVIIHRDDYRLTELDNIFISELCEVKRELF